MKFTTVIKKERKWFVATCVELGVASQGRTVKSAQKNLKEAVELFLEDTPKSKIYSSNFTPIVRILELKHA